MKRRTILYHLVFWAALYLLWLAVFRSYSFAITKTMTIEFCYLIFITADFYTINNFIVPQFLHKKRYVLFVLGTLITTGISAWLRALTAVQMNLHFFHLAPIDFNTLLVNSTFNISIWVLLITIGKMLIDRVQTQRKIEQLEKERIKNELDYLKAQINPHALFNSLNTIYGHIDKSNKIARGVLLQFSEILRYQLYDCTAETVSLGKEITYIKNYVAFQQLRKGENLLVDINIDYQDVGLKIAPLLLITLIENAFKFVSSFSSKENKILIILSVKDSVLNSSFLNTKEMQHNVVQNGSNGIGLVNLKRRLELLYADKYELTTIVEDEFYQTILTINLA